MRVQQVDIEEIVFIKKDYRKSMYESIKRIGLSFPIKVVKRLSAIMDMKEEEIYFKRRKINIIVMNNGNSRSNDCWRSKNMH